MMMTATMKMVRTPPLLEAMLPKEPRAATRAKSRALDKDSKTEMASREQMLEIKDQTARPTAARAAMVGRALDRTATEIKVPESKVEMQAKQEMANWEMDKMDREKPERLDRAKRVRVRTVMLGMERESRGQMDKERLDKAKMDKDRTKMDAKGEGKDRTDRMDRGKTDRGETDRDKTDARVEIAQVTGRLHLNPLQAANLVPMVSKARQETGAKVKVKVKVKVKMRVVLDDRTATKDKMVNQKGPDRPLMLLVPLELLDNRTEIEDSKTAEVHRAATTEPLVLPLRMDRMQPRDNEAEQETTEMLPKDKMTRAQGRRERGVESTALQQRASTPLALRFRTTRQQPRSRAASQRPTEFDEASTCGRWRLRCELSMGVRAGLMLSGWKFDASALGAGSPL